MCNQGCIPFSQSRLTGFPCKPERTSDKRLITNLILVWFSMEQKIEFLIAKSSMGFEPEPKRFRRGALTNWAMKPRTSGKGSNEPFSNKCEVISEMFHV